MSSPETPIRCSRYGRIIRPPDAPRRRTRLVEDDGYISSEDPDYTIEDDSDTETVTTEGSSDTEDDDESESE